MLLKLKSFRFNTVRSHRKHIFGVYPKSMIVKYINLNPVALLQRSGARKMWKILRHRENKSMVADGSLTQIQAILSFPLPKPQSQVGLRFL